MDATPVIHELERYLTDVNALRGAARVGRTTHAFDRSIPHPDHDHRTSENLRNRAIPEFFGNIGHPGRNALRFICIGPNSDVIWIAPLIMGCPQGTPKFIRMPTNPKAKELNQKTGTIQGLTCPQGKVRRNESTSVNTTRLHTGYLHGPRTA